VLQETDRPARGKSNGSWPSRSSMETSGASACSTSAARGRAPSTTTTRSRRRRFGGARSRSRKSGVEDGDEYLSEKIDDAGLSEKTVSNHLTLLTTMLNLATTFKVPWLLRVPKFHKPKIGLFSRDYQWLRSADEVRRLLVAARTEDEHVYVFYSMAVYTGMRAGELRLLGSNEERRLVPRMQVGALTARPLWLLEVFAANPPTRWHAR
jgi:hypothetical protein